MPLLVFSLAATAKMELYEWHHEQLPSPLVLAVKTPESPEQAAQKYLRYLETNPDLKELLWNHRLDMAHSDFKPLDPKRSKALLIANRSQDYSLDSQRVINTKNILNKYSYGSYMLPIASLFGLNPAQKKEFILAIAENFPLLVPLGGDDVETRFYKEENIHARPTSTTRDFFEIDFIKNYYKQSKGFILGICRGAQITAISLGYKLIQDVTFHIGEKVAHGDDWHPVKIFKTKNKILSSTPLVNRSIDVKSVHHQSVKFHENGPLEIAAMSSDGVVEALEFKNGKGLLVQFHPEFMNNQVGENIIHQAIIEARKEIKNRCLKSYSSF